MGTLTSLTDRKWILPVAGVVGGILLGVLYAWVLNPVKWVDGEPHQLRADLQADYLRMAIDSYSINRDADLALQRYDGLQEFGAEALNSVSVEPGEVSAEAIQSFRALLEIEREFGTVLPAETEQPVEAEEGSGLQLSNLIVPVCGGTLAIAVLLAGALYLRSRSSSDEDEQFPAERMEALMSDSEPVQSAPEPPPPPPPPPVSPFAADDTIATFRTIYTIGEDDYDDSFSIESSSGEFLGECGVGIGELIGVGEPKKVSAFEVWLFDKNDIQTVTKVLMSDYAFRDDETRSRLSAKGDPVPAEPGGIVSLQTASLEVEARVVDMSYGRGTLPEGSYFERLTIELRAWSRDSGGL